MWNDSRYFMGKITPLTQTIMPIYFISLPIFILQYLSSNRHEKWFQIFMGKITLLTQPIKPKFFFLYQFFLFFDTFFQKAFKKDRLTWAFIIAIKDIKISTHIMFCPPLHLDGYTHIIIYPKVLHTHLSIVHSPIAASSAFPGSLHLFWAHPFPLARWHPITAIKLIMFFLHVHSLSGPGLIPSQSLAHRVPSPGIGLISSQL